MTNPLHLIPSPYGSFQRCHWSFFLKNPLSRRLFKLAIQAPSTKAKSTNSSKSVRALAALQRLMNPTTSSKPKCKFSSRNLNAVFKAPVGTKPLPNKTTGLRHRVTNPKLVLGRASVAPPAPLNTPSLKRESHVNNVQGSLVLAGSSWAKNAEKVGQLAALEQHFPDAGNATTSSPVAEKVWTRENVAEHLHTFRFVARSTMAVTNSGRWGDDAVEDDIVQDNICRRLQKEREFPDLKKTLEETPTCHEHGHVSTAGEMQSMRPQQEPEQRHGRATGRWAHFNKEERHHSMQDTGSRWSHSQYERDEVDRWSRDQSRFDDCRLESRLHEVKSGVALSEPFDGHGHFSRSDVRFDTMASGSGDRAMSHSPHCMDWSTARLSHRGAVLSSISRNEDSCVQTLQPFRSSSPPPVPAASAIAVKLASERADHEPDHVRDNHQCTKIVGSETEESSTLVVEELQSRTEFSSNLLSHSSPSPPQLIKLLRRPKMLFDPRTGSSFNVEDVTQPDKRQIDERSGEKSKTSGLTRANKRTDCKRKVQAKASTLKSKSERTGRKETDLTLDIVDAGSSISEMTIVANEQESVVKGTACVNDILSTSSLNAVEMLADQADILVTSKGKRVKRDRVKTKQPLRQEGKFQVIKPPRESRPSTALSIRPKQQHRNLWYTTAVSVRGHSTPNNGKAAECINYNIPMQCDGREAVGDKPVQHEIIAREQEVQSDEQQDLEVSPEDGGFETIKSRRTLLFEKLQRRVITTVTVAPLLDETNRDCASLAEQAVVPIKEIYEKKSCMAAEVSKVAIDAAVKLRGKAGSLRRNANEGIKDKKTKWVAKQATGTRGCTKKETPAKAKVSVSHTGMREQVALRVTEQIAGEAPAEAPLVKKSTKGTKVTVKRKKDRQSDQACKTNDPKRSLNLADTSCQQEPSKRQGAKQSAHSGVQCVGSVTRQAREPGGITAKRKTKQVRQVYVVKTLAPTPASATFTAV